MKGRRLKVGQQAGRVFGIRLDRPNLVLLVICGIALVLLMKQTMGGMGSISLSSHTCTGSGKANTTCVLHNVIVYKAKVYYVTLDPSVPPVPPLDITWRPEGQFDIPFPIRPVDPDTLAAMGVKTYSVVQNAVLWYRLDLVDNFYHMVAEHGATIHHLMCTYLGLCEHVAEALDKFRMVFMDPKPASVWAAVNDNWGCFSSHRPIYFGEMSRSSHGYQLQKAVVGIGPNCRAFLFCMQDQFGGTLRQRLPSEMMASWRRRLHMCFKLDPDRSVTTAPRPVIYLMNRAFDSRRSFVNFDDAVAAIKVAYPTADVRALYLENRNLVEQARAFSQVWRDGRRLGFNDWFEQPKTQ